MKVRSRASSSNLFLIELIIAILFFSIASAVCVQIFVKSDQLSNDATALSSAVDECSAAAEIITNSDDMRDAKAGISKVWKDVAFEDGRYQVCFNDNMEMCRQSSSMTSYVMNISLADNGDLISSDIEMTRSSDGKSIYSLDVMHHVQKGGGNE